MAAIVAKLNVLSVIVNASSKTESAQINANAKSAKMDEIYVNRDT